MIQIAFIKPKLIFVYSLLLFSCSGIEEEKVVRMEDLIPREKKVHVTKASPKDTFSFSLFNVPLADSCGIRIQEFTEIMDPMFPDRFAPKNKFKLKLNSQETGYFIGQWTYPDSLKTMNAFFNWIDCFGKDCQSFKFGQEVNMQNEGMLLFVNDTSITYVSTSLNPNLKNWQRYFEKQYDIDQWDIVVWQQSRKKAVWMKYDQLPGKKKKQFLPLFQKE